MSARRSARILLVDDDASFRCGMSELLDLEGYETVSVGSGADAIRRVESGLVVDLVILDMNMPGLTGGETLVRLLEIRPDQPVLLASGSEEDAMAALAKDRAHVDWIRKPFAFDELMAKLAALGIR